MQAACIKAICRCTGFLVNCHFLKQLEQKPQITGWLVRRGIAVLLLGLFLSVVAIARCEPLHKLIHRDADNSHHHCVVTHLQSGHYLESPVCHVAMVLTTVPATALVLIESIFVPTVDLTLPPSCGPPALLS